MTPTLPPPEVATESPKSDGTSTGTSTGSGRNAVGLVRPRDGRRIAGVCAAIADHNGWSRTTVRLVAALSIFLPGPQVLAYLIAWVVIPSADDPADDRVTPSSAAG